MYSLSSGIINYSGKGLQKKKKKYVKKKKKKKKKIRVGNKKNKGTKM